MAALISGNHKARTIAAFLQRTSWHARVDFLGERRSSGNAASMRPRYDSYQKQGCDEALHGFSVFPFACTACASAGEKLVDVSPLDGIYDRESPVVLVLRNVGHRSIRVYSNLEVVDEHGEWVTWPFRIEDGRPGTVSKQHDLGSGDSTHIEFDITKITLPPIPPGQSAKVADRLKFRFRVSALLPQTCAWSRFSRSLSLSGIRMSGSSFQRVTGGGKIFTRSSSLDQIVAAPAREKKRRGIRAVSRCHERPER